MGTGKPHSAARFSPNVPAAIATPVPCVRMRIVAGQNRYCFWYYRKGAQKESRDPSEAYESGIKVVESFQTVEHFWRIYNHILRADQVVCCIFVFVRVGMLGVGFVCVVGWSVVILLVCLLVCLLVFCVFLFCLFVCLLVLFLFVRLIVFYVRAM